MRLFNPRVTQEFFYRLSIYKLNFQIAGSYWTTTYATTASVLDVVGQAVEEAAFDFEGLVELPEILPVGKYFIQFVLVLGTCW